MRQVWFINIFLFTFSLNAFAADSLSKKISDSVAEGYEKLNERAFGNAMTDQINEMKQLAESPDKVAKNLKRTLDLYSDSVPLRIVANDVCSAQGPKFNAYYKNEVFAFNELPDSTEKNSHTTQIRYKQSVAKEKEKYVQVESYRRSVYGTYTYAIIDGNKETPLSDVKTSIRLIDQFVSVQVIPVLDAKSEMDRGEHAAVKLELDKAWHFFKEIGACCAAKECKKALVALTKPSSSSGNRSPPSPSTGAGAH